MKLNYITLLITIILIVTSCENNTSLAKEYNDKLNGTINEILIPLMVIEKSAYKDFAKGNNENAIASCKKAREIIEESRTKVKVIVPPAIPRAEDLKTGYLNLLEWYKLFYEDFSKMAEAKSEDAIVESFDKLETCKNNISNVEAMIKQLHKDFANQNGFQSLSD